MNKLSNEKRAEVVRALVEGNSIRATVRMTGVAKNTIVKLLADLGTACADYHDHNVHGVTSKIVQVDEIWSFCYCKAANIPQDKQLEFGYGDVWTWTAIDADTKLCISWLVGDREMDSAKAFIGDLSSRLANRIQLTSDGYGAYLKVVPKTFGGNVDFAMLVKEFKGVSSFGSASARYSPARCVGCKKTAVSGDPDPAHISTSFVERQNLTMRMSMRRFTRLTNGFSKKVANLMHAVALHFMYYNFCRVHQTLRVTPAMAAGLSDHVWEIEELVSLLECEKSN
jgi:IS1 family transposase